MRGTRAVAVPSTPGAAYPLWTRDGARLLYRTFGLSWVAADGSGILNGTGCDTLSAPVGVPALFGAARDVALSFLGKGLQTIVFAPSRLATEVLVTYLKQALETKPGSEGVIRGYRATVEAAVAQQRALVAAARTGNGGNRR